MATTTKKRTDPRTFDSVKQGISFSERLSRKRKEAKGWEWLKGKIDNYDLNYPKNFGEEYLREIEDNRRILMGDGMKYYGNNEAKSRMDQLRRQAMTKHKVPLIDRQLFPYDVITPIIFTLYGERVKTDAKLVATSSSAVTRNYIKTLQAEKLQQLFVKNFYEPIKQQALQQTIVQRGIQDLHALTVEQRQDLSSEVEQAAFGMLPRDIAKIIRNGPQGIHERQAQQLGDYIWHKLNIKFRTDYDFLYYFLDGGVLFNYKFINGSTTFRRVEVAGLYTEGNDDDRFVDNNHLFLESEELSPSEIWDRWGGEIKTRKQLEDMDDLFEGYIDGASRKPGGNRRIGAGLAADIAHSSQSAEMIQNMDALGFARLAQSDLITAEGQRMYGQLVSDYTSTRVGGLQNKIPVLNCTCKSLKKMWLVENLRPSGAIVKDWHTEAYTPDPSQGDLRWEERWVNEYMHGVKVGDGENALYFELGPLAGQQRSLDDPQDLYSSYTGGFHLKMIHTDPKSKRRYVRVATPIHRAKPFLKDIHYTFKQIRDREATDIGRVMLMALDAIPDKMDWGEYMEMIRALKIVPLDLHKAGLTAADLNVFKEVNLEQMNTIIQKANYLQLQINLMAEVLLSNRSYQGTAPASTSVTNNINNLRQVELRTSPVSVWYDQIIENLVNRLAHLEKQAVKDGNKYARIALDNGSIMEIMLDPEVVDQLMMAIRLVTDSMEINAVDLAKNILLPGLTAQNIKWAKAMELVWAKNKAEVRQLALEADMDNEDRMQQANETQLQQLAKTQEFQERLLMLEESMKTAREREKGLYVLEAADKNASVIERGQDIDKDGQPDFLKKADQDRELRREQMHLEDERERIKLAIERERNRLMAKKQKQT